MIKVERTRCTCERDLVITIPAEEVEEFNKEFLLAVNFYIDTRHSGAYVSIQTLCGLVAGLGKCRREQE